MKKEVQQFKSDQDFFDSGKTAEFLGIHKASIRNWIRHGYLHPVKSSDKPLFDKQEVEELKKNIDAGNINRLKGRANKSKANERFLPDEYSVDSGISASVQQIADFILKNHLNINSSLFYLSLNILIRCRLISLSADSANPFHSNNSFLQAELTEWMQSLQGLPYNKLYFDLLEIRIPSSEDILGLIYQSLIAEGRKSKMGSYYTPKSVVDTIIREHYKPGCSFLDPCCGTGRFLLSAAEVSDQPEQITGFDIDQLAVWIARINLIIKYKNLKFKPQVYRYNTIMGSTGIMNRFFDLVATNPPWGMHFNKDEIRELKRRYPKITSGESFSYFIHQGYHLLREGGMLSFILPEAILNVKTHKDIRQFILENTSISSVHFYNRMFKKVFTRVIRFDLKKPAQNDTAGKKNIKIFQPPKTYKFSQENLYKNPDFIFSFYHEGLPEKILEKAYSLDHTTLKNQSEWALGIVTGDNKKFLSAVKSDQYEEVVTGKEVERYTLKEARNYIKFSPELFQQCAPPEKYRTMEKLIYKFISSSLVFAYDNKGKLTLNSANILIPKIPDYPIKTILALFNSSLYQFIFQKKFNSIKVLRSHLEVLPLPVLNQKIHNNICERVGQILNGDSVIENLDIYIFDLFGLNSEEIKYVHKSIRR